MKAADGAVPLYDNLGGLTLKVGTHSAKAQAYFDQGLRWAFGFNHAEAQRAFQANAKAIDTAFTQHVADCPARNTYKETS